MDKNYNYLGNIARYCDVLAYRNPLFMEASKLINSIDFDNDESTLDYLGFVETRKTRDLIELCICMIDEYIYYVDNKTSNILKKINNILKKF